MSGPFREVPNWRRGKAVPDVSVDGTAVVVFEGETIAGALWRLDEPICRSSERLKQPRGYFCGMGACFDCLVTVDGVHGVRACLTPVHPHMRILREHGRHELKNND